MRNIRDKSGVPFDNFGLSGMGDFQSRFQEALRRRLFPNAPLHLKQIAGAIGRSENSVTRWWRGETRITGDDLYRIARFLAERGDFAFLQEVFGEFLPPEGAHATGEEKVLELIRSLMRHRIAGDAGADRHSWITAEGDVMVAALGHAVYVRRTLQLPQSLGDLSAYAMRVLGWIAVTERADRTVVIRHDGRRVAPLAAERIQAWLDDCADRIIHVRRLVHMDQQWIEAHHATADAAAAAIARIAFILRIPRRPWIIKPLPLDSITDSLLCELISVYKQAPHELIHTAAKLGAFTTSNLFGINREEVVSHHVATGFGFDTSLLVGMNVLARADTDYATMVHARILRTRREGPNYNELIGTIDDRHVRYLNLALPEPGPQGRVLTSTVMLELDRVDA
jgi:transcriptional regulator with XRE-family HTH domain